MVLWGLSKEVLWPRSMESSFYFWGIEQVAYEIVVVLNNPIFMFLRERLYDFRYIWYTEVIM
jgi:hypothetical protein